MQMASMPLWAALSSQVYCTACMMQQGFLYCSLFGGLRPWLCRLAAMQKVLPAGELGWFGKVYMYAAFWYANICGLVATLLNTILCRNDTISTANPPNFQCILAYVETGVLLSLFCCLRRTGRGLAARSSGMIVTADCSWAAVFANYSQ